MKLFPSGVMALGGAGLQALGVALAVGPARSVGTAVALVAAGAALGGGGLLIGVRRHARRSAQAKASQLGEILLIAAFSLFVPVLGLVGLGGTLWLRSRSVARKVNSDLVETDAPPLPASPLHTDETSRFGPGSLEGILRHGRDPNTRLRVVLACRQLPGRLAVPLLRLALRDPVDDVRLLAYAVLESKERQIQSQIQNLYARASARQTGTFATLTAGAAAGAAPTEARPQIDLAKLQLPRAAHAKLAELYWELVYQGLVEGEMMSFSLERVLSHSGEVLRAGQGSPRMALLAGRALLLRGRSQEARAMLEDAERRGLPREVVGPYLAEVDYLERKPAEVRRQIETFRASARLRPGLAVIVERWA